MIKTFFFKTIILKLKKKMSEYYLDSNLIQSSPQNRAIMLFKILALSEKLKNHTISCGWKEDCKICPKIRCWMEIFINYEKVNNKKIQLDDIIDGDFVEKVFFKDDVFVINKWI